MSAAGFLSIGQLADKTGVSVSALRHYDQIGVIAASCREGGKRRFDGDAVGRVIFTRRAQRAGFSLAEIRDILADTPARTQRTLADKIAELRQQQAELATTIAMLENMQACGCEAVTTCPTVTSSS